jgi:hypothetical protein
MLLVWKSCVFDQSGFKPIKTLKNNYIAHND